MPPRVAILPPVPVPYREPLFRGAGRARPCGAARDLPRRQPARLGSASGLVPRARRLFERGAAGLAARAARAQPADRAARARAARSARARPDCVVSWEYGPATLRALAWARRRARAAARVQRAHPLERRRAVGAAAALAPRCSRRASTASSWRAPRAWSACGRWACDPERVEVALQSADLSGPPRAAGRRGAPAPDGPVRVLAVGRLVPDKNLDVLIDAFAQAGFGEGEAELEIRGSGPLEARAARAGAAAGRAAAASRPRRAGGARRRSTAAPTCSRW